jgi:hypothetical protein
MFFQSGIGYAVGLDFTIFFTSISMKSPGCNSSTVRTISGITILHFVSFEI